MELASSGLISINSSKITGNTTSGNGGGITAGISSSITIKNAIVTGNFASGNGAGLDIYDTTNFQVSGGTISGNASGAGSGGGVFAYSATGSITNVTISGNTAAIAGGGVANGGPMPGTITLQIAKVTANSAPSGPNISGPTITLVTKNSQLSAGPNSQIGSGSESEGDVDYSEGASITVVTYSGGVPVVGSANVDPLQEPIMSAAGVTAIIAP